MPMSMDGCARMFAAALLSALVISAMPVHGIIMPIHAGSAYGHAHISPSLDKVTSAGPSEGTVLADSVADFSSSQGHNHWYYGYYAGTGYDEGTTFTELPYFVRGVWSENSRGPVAAPWTALWADGGHPNGAPDGDFHDAVRRWISPVSGNISMSISIAKQDARCGNGVYAFINVDGTRISERGVAYNDTTGAHYSVTAAVSIGSKVDFVIAPWPKNDSCDATKFTATITRWQRPPDELADSVADFSLAQGHAHWYYGYYAQPGSSGSFTALPYRAPTLGKSWAENINGAVAPPWTSLWADGGHPGGANNGSVHWAVRRWISPVSEIVTISGIYAKEDSIGGDGTTGHILLNGKELWARSIAYNDSKGLAYSVTATVAPGSTVDFAIDPNSDDGYNATRFTATIVASPAPRPSPSPSPSPPPATIPLSDCSNKAVGAELPPLEKETEIDKTFASKLSLVVSAQLSAQNCPDVRLSINPMNPLEATINSPDNRYGSGGGATIDYEGVIATQFTQRYGKSVLETGIQTHPDISLYTGIMREEEVDAPYFILKDEQRVGAKQTLSKGLLDGADAMVTAAITIGAVLAFIALVVKKVLAPNPGLNPAFAMFIASVCDKLHLPTSIVPYTMGNRVDTAASSPPTQQTLDALSGLLGAPLVEQATVGRLTVDGVQKHAGQTIAFSGTGFTPHGPVAVMLWLNTRHPKMIEADLRADAIGRIRGHITLPTTAETGTWVVAAIDSQALRNALASFIHGRSSPQPLVIAAQILNVHGTS